MNESKYYPSQDPMRKLRQEMTLRNFSPKTIKSYLYYITHLLKLTNKSPREINSGDVRNYLESLAENKSASTVNIAHNALKFYFERILKRKFFVNLPRMKKEKYLPVVLSKDEVKRMIEATDNPKHKFLIQFLYSTGMRISEVVKVRMGDVDFDRKMVRVRQGKGKKDRYTLLAGSLLETLEKQSKLKKSDDYLFTGVGGKDHWQVMSAQKVIYQAAVKAGINKKVSAHTLRHSFATHLLEEGTDIRYIQSLLGHARLETTQIYTKVANNILSAIKNPLD